MLKGMKAALLGTGVSLALASSVSAAPVSFNLNATFLNGPLVGTPLETLLFTVYYDDDELTYGTADDGDGILSPLEGLEIDLFGEPFFEEYDVDYPFYPRVVFEDYIPISIDYLIDRFTLPELAVFRINRWRVGGNVESDKDMPDLFALVYDQSQDAYTTGSTVTLVPLPAGLPLLLGGLGLLGLLARRRA